MDAPGNSPGSAPATTPKTTFKEKVFSGVQPTGNLHLGNYLGAVTKFVDLQDRYDCIYCVVDMHAITMWQDPADLKRAIREVTAAYIAAGVDPARALQSRQVVARMMALTAARSQGLAAAIDGVRAAQRAARDRALPPMHDRAPLAYARRAG